MSVAIDLDKTFEEKLKYYHSKTYHSTEHFFNQLNDLHSKGGIYSKIAGQLFEDFNMIAFPTIVDNVVKIWDANDINDIPKNVIKDIFKNLTHKQIESIFVKSSTYGLDKICLFNDATYGLISDKSILSIKEKSLSSDKIKGLISLATLDLENVSGYYTCSNALTVAKRFNNLFKDKVVYVTYHDYVPNSEDFDGLQKDKELWKRIKKIRLTKKSSSILKYPLTTFKLDGKYQTDWTDKNIKYAEYHIEQYGKVRHWAEASMGFGKSKCDPYQSAVIEKVNFSSEFTGTPVPVNVTVFNNCGNAKQNGKRLQDVKKQICGNNRQSIWATQAEDAIDPKDNIPQIQTLDVNSIVLKVIKAVKLGMPVDIITLMNDIHLKTLQKVEKDLQRHFPGFKFWEIAFDECDLLAVHMGSILEEWFNFAPIRWYGSTGTPSYTKSNQQKLNHNLMDNTSKWGSRTAKFTFQEAQDAKLVPPLQVIWVGVNLSEIKDTLLQGVKLNKGDILSTPINNAISIKHNGEDKIINVEFIARMWGIIKMMSSDPTIFLGSRMLGFTNFLHQAQLVNANWKWIVQQIEGQTLIGRKLSNLCIELMQEGSTDPKTNDRKIHNAWSHSESLILVQKLFGRGTDLQFDVGFHFVLKTFKSLIQELCRITRLDRSKPWDEQWRHYIMVVIKNDIDETSPTYDQELCDRLKNVLEYYGSAKEELELAWKKGGKGGSRGPVPPKSWKAIDIDWKDLDSIVKTISRTSPNGWIMANGIDILHSDMLKEMMALPNPFASLQKQKVFKTFLEHPKFLKLKGLSKQSDINLLKNIWIGYNWGKNSDTIRFNIQTWKLHLEQYEQARQQNVGKFLVAVKQYFNENPMRSNKLPSDEILDYCSKKPGAKKIVDLIKKRKRVGNIVGDLVRGDHHHISKDEQQIQKQWFEKQQDNIVDIVQQILDEAAVIYRWGMITEDVLKKIDNPEIDKTFNNSQSRKLLRGALKHDLITKGNIEGVPSWLSDKLNFTAYHNAVEQQVGKMKQMATEIWQTHKDYCDNRPYAKPSFGSPTSKLIDLAQNKYDISINKKQLSELTGVRVAKLQKTNNGTLIQKECYTLAQEFTNEKEIMDWNKNHLIKRISILKEIQEFLKKQPKRKDWKAVEQKFKLDYNDIPDWCKNLDKHVKQAKADLQYMKKSKGYTHFNCNSDLSKNKLKKVKMLKQYV